MRDLKYLLAYLAPIAAYAGIYAGGWWSFGSMYIGFVAVPFLELFLPFSETNFTPEEEEPRSKRIFFDFLLYLNLPILLGLLWYYFQTVGAGMSTTLELVGMTFSVGLIIGTIGINVAHELGHRSDNAEQRLSQLLLCTALYTHFFIEHNRGHHKNVSTDLDPASAKKGESIYAFWIRSVSGSYLNAWKLESARLKRLDQSSWSLSNQMVQFSIAQVIYLLAIGLIFGWELIPWAIAAAIVGILLLESVNYIEHYGLRRKKSASGRYEPIGPQHSWNSDHELGRIFLYELTRHSDHHYKANRKYQVLRHFDQSPQLPMGYPGAILTALIPPVWFSLMEKQLQSVGEL